MTTLHKAAQMALDALERSFSSAMVHALKARIPECGDFAGIAQDLDFSLAALREALEAPEPEPVAWRYGVPKLNGVEWRYTLHKTRDDATPLYAAPPAAPAPAAPVPDGCVMVPREPTPEMIAAMPYPANTIPAVGVACYRAMIAASPAAPAAPVVPLTDEQIWSMWMSSEFRGNGGQADWFCEGIRAAEAHHGITGGKP